jgi:mannose-6-phosphate isomerase-like protein (cupin superfamily)
MGIVAKEDRNYQPFDESDPDDYRPNSRFAFVIDPGSPGGGRVRSLAFIFETCAPGDFVPLHTHTTDEAIVIDGEAEVRLGDDHRRVSAGTVVFVPAGTPHSWGNPGSGPLQAQAIFATDVLAVTYIERNPAPDTESDGPQPPLRIDLSEFS